MRIGPTRTSAFPRMDGLEVDRDIGENVSYSEMSGSSSVVECNLAKVDVAGSNPVSRSILLYFVQGR